MSKEKVVFFCNECGYESAKWLGRCPSCDNWNSFVEEKIKTDKKTGNRSKVKIGGSEVKLLSDIQSLEGKRINTGYEEVNRVLGGGLVEGSLILLGGEPGIGKSTLVLQLCDKLSSDGKVIYVSGEESDSQIKLRADRLNINSNSLMFLGETDIAEIEEKIYEQKPKYCIIDSIQTMYDSEISSVPGSVSQVREVTARMLELSKKEGITIVVIGHVTKDGNIAGPRLLEHMVDVVLYIEGERFLSHRILRVVKNRFGSTNEIGIFEMHQKGLVEVKNMTEIFLDKSEECLPGTVTTALLEGNSTLVLEIQALTAHSYYNMPRRVSTGYDYNRLNMIIAVIEKVCGINLGSQDIYVNVVGGMKIVSTAADLAVALAIISSYKNIIVKKDCVFIGEISLNGRIRNVVNIDKMIKELQKIGYKKIYIPASQSSGIKVEEGVRLLKVSKIQDLLSKYINKE